MNINYSRNYTGYYDIKSMPIYHDDIVTATINDEFQVHVVEYKNGEWIWGDYLLEDVVRSGSSTVVGIMQKQLFKNLDGYHQDIIYWSLKRGLNKADPMKQMVKLMEEIGELANGLNKSNDKVIVDSVGDVFVVLTILCQQLKIDLISCVAAAYNEIKDRKGKLVNGIFVKEQDLSRDIQVLKVSDKLIPKFNVGERVAKRHRMYPKHLSEHLITNLYKDDVTGQFKYKLKDVDFLVNEEELIESLSKCSSSFAKASDCSNYVETK